MLSVVVFLTDEQTAKSWTNKKQAWTITTIDCLLKGINILYYVEIL